MDAVSLAGVWYCGSTRGAASSPCCLEARVVLFGLLWFTLLPSGSERPLVQAVHGCCLSVLEASGRISCSTCCVSRCSHLEIWTLPSPSYPSVLLVYGCCLLSTSYLGRVRCLGRQWIHVLREALDEFQHFLHCGELMKRSFSVRSEWSSVHSRCCWLQFLSARLARWNLDIASTSSPFLGSCGGFLLHCRVLQGASASVHRQSGGYFGCFTETGLIVQIVQKTVEIAQVQFLTGWDARCCTTTGAWFDRAENSGSPAVAVL